MSGQENGNIGHISEPSAAVSGENMFVKTVRCSALLCITEEINFEEAAKQAYSSPFHFQRVFTILCGMSLDDYIRMRRLSLAGEELSRGKAKIIDIALKYGYDSSESFSRAFTRFHGIAPSKARSMSMPKTRSLRCIRRQIRPTRTIGAKSGLR